MSGHRGELPGKQSTSACFLGLSFSLSFSPAELDRGRCFRRGPARFKCRSNFPGRCSAAARAARDHGARAVPVISSTWFYVDGRHVTVGHDKWKFGGAISAPILVDYDQPQNVEIRLSSLDANPGETKEATQ